MQVCPMLEAGQSQANLPQATPGVPTKAMSTKQAGVVVLGAFPPEGGAFCASSVQMFYFWVHILLGPLPLPRRRGGCWGWQLKGVLQKRLWLLRRRLRTRCVRVRAVQLVRTTLPRVSQRASLRFLPVRTLCGASSPHGVRAWSSGRVDKRHFGNITQVRPLKMCRALCRMVLELILHLGPGS